MKVLMVIMLFILISCGSKSEDTGGNEGGNSPICHNSPEALNKIWTSEVDGKRYDLTNCAFNNTCRLCFSNFCNTFDDVDVRFSTDTVRLNYFVAPRVLNGSWQICDEVLEIYNLSDGSAPETFR